jgi:hypothetical protein
MPRVISVAMLVLLAGGPVSAQVAVSDPSVTTRNAVTASLMEQLLATQRQQHSQLRRMAQRLSLFTALRKYAVPDVPRWRIHDFENPDMFLFSRAYHAALNYGDPSGAAYLAVSHPVLAASGFVGGLSASARRALSARLATLDAADASAISATHDSGRVRFNGRREQAAIDALEADALNESLEQSATAVLDKISGASLIGSRQRQARAQLLAGVVEQLLIESKRSRDTEAAVMNMQLVSWRDGRAANDAFVAGTGDALRTWRQP